ncbi:MAG: ClbS/DfsB family four-helix bundle protein [Micrococcales bacterium]|nr:ClbS/DfsB family four-helix bundle protein [Micrococcales bacterium]
MPRPTTRDELLVAAAAGYDKVVAFVAALPAEQREAEFAFDDRDRNVRDVVAHLVAWQRMMRRWYDEGMADRKPAIPGEGYTWKTLPELNQVVWADAQGIGLVEAMAALSQTHQDMTSLVEAHTDDELFTKKRYRWTGTTSLGAYLVSATSSHYDWAMTKLRKAKKTWPPA